ncbi:TIGR02450 family Trp-rich protein [Roseateles sp.]|uniref:TIGR02450 family Trp-rich protein n=1 Tax=Roseateles sp. TaxID=1971397 RepID=UPI003BA56466
MNRIHPKKLLLSKWTARQPECKEKHFLVTRLIEAEPVDAANPPRTAELAWVEIEAIHSGRSRRIAWRDLKDDAQWRQGWQ